MTPWQKLKKELKETEEYAVEMRKSSENYEKLLTETREELRKSRVFAKERGDKLAKAAIEKNEWQKLATYLMEQLVKTKAELEVAKIPF